VDCLRIFIIFGAEADYPELDFFGFLVKSTTIFIAFALLGAINVLFSEYGGITQRHSLFVQLYLSSLTIIFTGASIFWSYRTTPTGEFNFQMYQVETPMYILCFLAYLPVALFIVFRNLHIRRTVDNKKIQFKILLLTIMALFLVLERAYSVGFYALANSFMGLPIESSLLLDFAALTVISCLFLIIIFKYHGLVESVGTYFSIKQLYILRNNGILMFEYDFENKRLLDTIDSNDPLIGGFIYAICEGLKGILKSEKITSFSSGNRSLIIQRSTNLITVLVVTEDSILFHQKLLQFMNLFETHYKKELEEWNGEISIFDQGKIQKWILETISES